MRRVCRCARFLTGCRSHTDWPALGMECVPSCLACCSGFFVFLVHTHARHAPGEGRGQRWRGGETEWLPAIVGRDHTRIPGWMDGCPAACDDEGKVLNAYTHCQSAFVSRSLSHPIRPRTHPILACCLSVVSLHAINACDEHRGRTGDHIMQEAWYRLHKAGKAAFL